MPNDTPLKHCYRCGGDKPLDQFHKERRRKDGLQTMCVDCARKRNREYYGAARQRIIQAKYGITLEEYEAFMEKPCAICGAEAVCLDHDHTTGLVRAALCHGCNVGIGFMADSPQRLRKAADYLEAH